MASRVLAIRNLTPPYDLTELANEYGDVEFINLPFGADGIIIGIGELARPKILINSDAPETRKKFTLAHEVGHIVIPWHTGTIVSHLDPGEEDFDYKFMESEANRFAAELLMPTDWLCQEFETSTTIEEYFRSTLNKSGASRDAAFFKIFRSLTTPVVCIQIDRLSRILGSARSNSAPHISNECTTAAADMFSVEHEFERFEIDGRHYLSWKFIGKNINDTDTRTWREILSEMLDTTDMNNKLQSINAILAASFNKNKLLSEPEICGSIIRAFANREELSAIFTHPLFEQYIVKRVKELSKRL